jgi:hypothetical protein
MALNRRTWVGRRAEVLNPLRLATPSGAPGELLYAAGRKVIIKKFHPKSKANPYSCFTVSDLKGKNVVTGVPLHTLSMHPPETPADLILAYLKKESNPKSEYGISLTQLIQNVGLSPRLVKNTCREMVFREHLIRLLINEEVQLRSSGEEDDEEKWVVTRYYKLTAPKGRPCVLVETVLNRRRTAFERLAGRDLF